MSDWRRVRIGDLAQPKGLVGGPFGSSLVGKDYVDAGVPVIRGTNMSPGPWIGGDFAFVSEQKFDRDLARNSASPGDIVFTQRGTLGQVALVPDEPFDTYVVSQSQMRLRLDSAIADTRFVYLACSSADFRKQISDHAISTGVPHINLGILGELTIPLPPLQEQQAIADVLGALDDKLAANATLLATAEGLLDALGRLVLSHGETSRRLESLAQVTKGVSYRRSDLADDSATAMVTLKSITRDGRYATAGLKGFVGQAKATQYLSEGDLVVAQTDLTQAAEVVGRAVRVPESSRHKELVASLDLAIVRPRGHVPSEYLLAILRSDEFRQHCRDRTSGTTVLHLGRGAIESFDAPWVEPDVQLRFSERVKPLHELMDTKARESESLVRVRDALLPQLMSGRIRVRDAERVVEGVV